MDNLEKQFYINRIKILYVNLKVLQIETEALKKMSPTLYSKYEYRYESLRKEFLILIRKMKLHLDKDCLLSEEEIEKHLDISERFVNLVNNFENDFIVISEDIYCD